MWWDYQNLDKPRLDSFGTRWNFRVWHDVVDLHHVARVFFWDDARVSTGVMIMSKAARTDVAALHAMIQKLASDPDLRARHERELTFPLERHYSSYGAFPEEAEL
jgi:hypothetical protein